MKKAFYIWAILLMATLVGIAAPHQLDPQSPIRKVAGDSLYRYTVTPWKCIYTHTTNGSTETRYYTREGNEKARLTDASFCALGQGPDHRDYYETLRTHTSGESKQVKGWYSNGVDCGKKPLAQTLLYNPNRCDKMGNWTYAGEQHRRNNAFVRELFYYDTPQYNATEDQAIDARIAELVNEVERKENPLSVENMPALVFGFAAKALYLFGLFVLFMMTFRRSALYLWFDIKATRKITPIGNGLLCKTLFYALLPVAMIACPTVKYILDGHSTAVLPDEVITETLIALAGAALYCWGFVMWRKRRVTARCARWELIYW